LYRGVLSNANLYVLLLRIDREIAEKVRLAGCPWCGGRLDTADFPPRKPRGAGAPLPKGYDKRLSFCCDKDGCRSRATPPSVRFLGRKLYLGAVVVVVAAMRHGVTAERAAKLSAWLGVSQRTIERWRRWWRELFPATPFWQAARGRLRSPVASAELPLSLLVQFVADDPLAQVVSLLRFISPLTAGSAGSVSMRNFSDG